MRPVFTAVQRLNFLIDSIRFIRINFCRDAALITRLFKLKSFLTMETATAPALGAAVPSTGSSGMDELLPLVLQLTNAEQVCKTVVCNLAISRNLCFYISLTFYLYRPQERSGIIGAI